MLLEQASRLVDEIDQFEKLKRSAGEAKSLQTRAEQLRPVAEKLVNSANALMKVRKSGIAVSFTPKEGEALGKRAIELLTGLRADPNNIVNPSFDIKFQFTDRLSNIAVAAENVALAAWQRHVAENSEHAPEEILMALDSIPDYRSTVAKIRALQKRVTLLHESVPADPLSAMEEIARIATEHRDIWEKMTAGGIPEQVIAFLRACGLEGAPLGSYTPAIAAWLSGRGLSHLFRVKLR